LRTRIPHHGEAGCFRSHVDTAERFSDFPLVAQVENNIPGGRHRHPRGDVISQVSMATLFMTNTSFPKMVAQSPIGEE
jgi:hypothetical protein